MKDVAAAYSATGAAWQAGPGWIYDRLAEVVVGRAAVPLVDRLVLDVGAGTGAASRAIARAGGRAVAVDPATGMLTVDRRKRPPALAGEAGALPVHDGAVGGYVAAFSLNHVEDPAAALREAARVTRPGGPVVASSYASGDDHPAKEVVSAALRARGWSPPPWWGELQAGAILQLATPGGCAEAARRAGLDARVERVDVELPDRGPAALVEWRLGMPHTAPFVAALDADARAALVAGAVRELGDDCPPLVRSILVITAVA